ncbi:MAG: hypothetical protein C0509_04880 [Acinetobacter sp.]|nr:hypothetical protein [Acinetobacter sp.]
MNSPLSLQSPQILCIDDDPDLLDGLALSLRRLGEVHTAPDGDNALILAAQLPRLAVVLCDMRMPGRNGAEVLSAFREQHPETTRILLTGYADIPSAISAVNQGNLFRFLSKPASNDVLQKAVYDGIKQHQLVIAERQLLTQTLRGSVEALSEALAMSSPAVFGQAKRVATLVKACAEEQYGQSDWMMESAAFLINLGLVGLPTEVQEKVLERQQLDLDEKELLDQAHLRTMHLLTNIPRLEQLRDLLRFIQPKTGGQLETPTDQHGLLREKAALIRAIIVYVSYESAGQTMPSALNKIMQKHPLSERLLAVIRKQVGDSLLVDCQVSLPINLLRPGMILNKALYTPSGIMVAPAGYQIMEGFSLRLMALLPKAKEQLYSVRIPSHMAEYASLLKNKGV